MYISLVSGGVAVFPGGPELIIIYLEKRFSYPQSIARFPVGASYPRIKIIIRFVIADSQP